MKRRLLIIAIFLLLGAVVNVAVAWGCALRLGRLGSPVLHRSDVAYWTFAYQENDSASSYYLKFLTQVGWPWSSVQLLGFPDNIFVVMDDWAFRGTRNFRSLGVIQYARPFWPGFAGNTIFYATLLWLLIAAPFALRRFLRLRRGLCPKCAYPMGESAVCTECGNQLRKHPVA